MVAVTPAAQEALKQVMQERNWDAPLRVFVAQGCGGAQLALGLDQAQETDEQFEVEGLTFLVDKELSGILGEVKLDFVSQDQQQGFLLTSEKPLPSGGGDGCGCGCSC